MKRLLLLALIFCLSTPLHGQRCGQKCGFDRWVVKTLTDTTITNIDRTPRRTTVHWLVHQDPPEKRPKTTRAIGLEWFAFSITALLIGYKKSPDDNDLHVVIRDLKTRETMIVEFKDPRCEGVCSSAYVNRMTKAREDFINSPAVLERGRPTGEFKKLNRRVVVEMIGVGFWDFVHRQIGVARNGIELHPVVFYREVPDER